MHSYKNAMKLKYTFIIIFVSNHFMYKYRDGYMVILKGEPLNHLGAGRLQFRSGSRCNGSLVGQ